jgi:Xaa-Pro aminopeptidase
MSAAIVSSEANFAYLTGYLTPSWVNGTRPIALVVAADGSCTAVLSSAEADRLAAVAPDIELVPYLQPVVRREDGYASVDFSQAALEGVMAPLRRPGVTRVGVELGPFASPTLAPQLVFRACAELGAEAEDIAIALIAQRRRKSASEVERIRTAGRTLGALFDRFAAVARPGSTEREIAATLTSLAAEERADRVGYAVVAADALGPLLGRPRDVAWKAESILHIDVGLVVDGYWADFCREFVCTEPTASARRAYERIRAAGQAGFEAARAGALASDVARAIAAELPAASSELFGRFGHGIGLELAEPPSLHLADDTPLEPGMTLCIEPAAQFDGLGQLVGEEMLLVRDGQPELLSPRMPSELIEIGAG